MKSRARASLVRTLLVAFSMSEARDVRDDSGFKSRVDLTGENGPNVCDDPEILVYPFMGGLEANCFCRAL
jgi:hypothetical protein